jgi:PBP1b-binding outer membrane lipoprotein LpoB
MKRKKLYALILLPALLFGLTRLSVVNEIKNNIQDTITNVRNRDLTSLARVSLSSVTDENLLRVIENIDSSEGVFLVQSNSEQYIVLNGIENSFIGTKSNLNDTTLEVSTFTIENSTTREVTIFRVRNNNSFNTISIRLNGSIISFDNVFVN